MDYNKNFKVISLLFSILFCTNAVAGLNLANGYATGQWYNPQRDGEGFFVEVIGEGDNLQISVAMYSYDEQGKQLWLVGNVPIEAGDVGATVPVFLIEGPVWGTAYDPADRSTTEFGTIVVQFPSCDSALFNVNSDVQGLESGSYSLIRLTEIVGMDCLEPPPPEPPAPPPSSTDITPGLWTGLGVCFYVNAEGTKIIEDDECDQGKSFSADIPGLEIDIDFNPDADACDADVACDAAWDIRTETNPQSGIETRRATCLNEFGGIGYIIFLGGSQADVYVVEGKDINGRFCAGAVVTATPAQ